MKSFYGWFKHAAASLLLLTASTGALAFPEIPFCPLGGPPGWWNRMVDDDDDYYPRPYYYPPPLAAPYWGPARYYPVPGPRTYPPGVNRQ